MATIKNYLIVQSESKSEVQRKETTSVFKLLSRLFLSIINIATAKPIDQSGQSKEKTNKTHLKKTKK
jgi:hypothetical protein